MYISQVFLNPRRRETRRLLASPQRMHAEVLNAFGPGSLPEPGGGGPRVLWRIDPAAQHSTLLLVSPEIPDLTKLTEVAGWPETHPGRSKPYDGFLDRLTLGSRWHYRIRANPTKAVSQPGRQRSKVVGHVTAEQQARWWLDKAAHIGLEIPTESGADRAADLVAVADRGTESFHRGGDPARGNRVHLRSAVFEGVCQISDSAGVRRALTEGVGRGKAYGCGLLTLVPVRG